MNLYEKRGENIELYPPLSYDRKKGTDRRLQNVGYHL